MCSTFFAISSWHPQLSASLFFGIFFLKHYSQLYTLLSCGSQCSTEQYDLCYLGFTIILLCHNLLLWISINSRGKVKSYYIKYSLIEQSTCNKHLWWKLHLQAESCLAPNFKGYGAEVRDEWFKWFWCSGEVAELQWIPIIMPWCGFWCHSKETSIQWVCLWYWASESVNLEQPAFTPRFWLLQWFLINQGSAHTVWNGYLMPGWRELDEQIISHGFATIYGIWT